MKLSYERSNAFYQTRGSIHKIGQPPHEWFTGTVETRQGFVEVYAEEPHGGGYAEKGYVRLEFIWAGRKYSRAFTGPFTKMGIARVAGRFAREIGTSILHRNALALSE